MTDDRPSPTRRAILPGAVAGAITIALTAHGVTAAQAAQHEVEPGDTVSELADHYGIATSHLLTWNGLGPDGLIHPGQTLRLEPPATARPASVAPAPRASAVTVSGGDTLWAIALRHGVELDELLAANGLDRASIIYPGQRLDIPASEAPTVADLDAEQTRNARIIIEVGRALDVPDRGIAIALATAMVESWLRNLDWGDRDSLGLFQQRPSQGWGTDAQVRDPHRAAAVFFGGAHDPNGQATRGLLDIPDWEALGFAEAAQAVQVSAYPERYGQWEQRAWEWLKALG